MEFSKPSLDSMEILRHYLQGNKYRACELSVANNIMWSTYYKRYYIIIEDMLVFGRVTDGKMDMVTYPIGENDEKKAFDALLEMFFENKLPFKMYLVNEEMYEKISAWYPDRFKIEYDRDDADYLYLRESLATLQGKKLHGKRNHINKFLQEHPDYEYEIITDKNKTDCLEFEDYWLAQSSEDNASSKKYEREAIRLALDNMDKLNLKGALIRVAGEVVAFTIGEELTEDTFVIHFEKAKSDMQGAYPIINREFVRRELCDYTYVNREEDMGIPGLRYAKETYQPIRLINKGVVTER